MPPGNFAALRWIVGLMGMLATLVLVPSAGLARDDAGGKMSFDLPADDAERSFKRFSERSGLEVLFLSETAANVRTNAVRGDYTPREAVDRMLAGTKLAATQKEKNGAVTIISPASANGRNGSAGSNPDSQSSKKKSLKP